MKLETIVPALRTEVQTRPIFGDVMALFASRQRARHQVTVRALYYRMAKEGFTYPKHAYATVLERLAALGVGELARDSRGKIRSLKNVRVTLQSLGNAVLQGDNTLRVYKKRNRYQKLPATVTPLRRPTPVLPSIATKPPVLGLTRITLAINDKSIGVDLPSNLTTAELAAFLSSWQEKKAM